MNQSDKVIKKVKLKVKKFDQKDTKYKNIYVKFFLKCCRNKKKIQDLSTHHSGKLSKDGFPKYAGRLNCIADFIYFIVL